MPAYIPGSGKTGRINKPRVRKNAPRHATPWEKVRHHGWVEVIHVPELGACWDSDAPSGSRGYHVVGFGTGNYLLAHRVSYEHHVGPIPEGLLIRHRCDNQDCINPEHLLPGTAADNVRDMVERGRQARGQNSVLTPSQASEVKAKLAAGAQMKPLAREYGVSRQTIRKIERGETWKWL